MFPFFRRIGSVFWKVSWSKFSLSSSFPDQAKLPRLLLQVQRPGAQPCPGKLAVCDKSAQKETEILLILVLAKLQHLLIWHVTETPTVELLSQEQLVSKGMGEVQGEHLWILLLPLCYFSLISILVIICSVIAACLLFHKMTKYLQLHEADSSEREESARHWESKLKWCPCRQVLFVTFFYIFPLRGGMKKMFFFYFRSKKGEGSRLFDKN